MTEETKRRDPIDDVKRTLRFIALGVAVILGGVVLGALGAYLALDQKTDDIVQARTEGRFTTCAGDQAFELNHNKLVKGTQDLIETVFGDTANARPPAERDAIKAYAAARVAEFEKTKVQVRDCTPAGILQFYENAPKPLQCPAGGDRKGYCK